MQRAARFTIAGLATALLVVLAGRSTDVAQRRQPNIVLFVADDMGYADIGVHGSKDIPTPNIDSLARNGIRFTDAYVTGPYCSPTRAGLLTGRYPQRFGHEFNLSVGPAHEQLGLPLSEKTMADRLKAAGYRTALFGKWHLGTADRFHPQSRGFDEFFGFPGGQHSYVDVGGGLNPILEGRAPATSIDYLTDALSARAVEFVGRNRAQPFFLYLAFNAVHTPMQASEKYFARFPGIADVPRRTYAAMLSAMDDGIGRTMDALRAAGLENDTLIFFFSDNGGPTMTGTTVNASNNAPLRGSKRQTWEGGIRVPFIIQWKGRLAPDRTDARPIIQLDVLPTALAAANLSSSGEKFDGVNLLPFLSGATPAAPHETLYWRFGEHMAIRRGNWKLVKTADGPLRGATPTTFDDLSGAGLYNLAADIGETKDLANSEPARVRELAELWRRWNKELSAPLWGPGIGPE